MKTLREKNMENTEKKSSPIRMALQLEQLFYCIKIYQVLGVALFVELRRAISLQFLLSIVELEANAKSTFNNTWCCSRSTIG